MRRARIVLLAFVTVVAVAAAAAWWWRDLPRRRVESTLASKLSAHVSLGRLEIAGLRSFVLHDLEVRRVAGQPRLSLVRVERLEALGEIREIVEGRLERLALAGVEVRVGPPDPAVPPPPPGPPAPLVAAALTVDRGRVLVASARGEIALDVAADLRDFGRAATGSASAAAPAVPLAPFGVDAALRNLAVAATIADGEARLDARAEADGVATIAARGTVDLAALRLVELEAEVLGLDLARWIALVPNRPEGLAVEGSVDLRARQPRGGRLAWSLEGELVEPPAEGRLHGEVSLDDPLAGGPVAGTIAATVRSIPVEAEIEGSIAADEEPRFDGAVRLRAKGIGPIVATGRASPSACAAKFSVPPTPFAAIGLSLPDGLAVEGTVEATGELDWPASPSLVRARVRARQVSARWRETARLAGADVRAELASSGLDAPWSVRDLAVDGTATVPPLAPVPLSLRGAARVEIAPASLRDVTIDVSAGDLATATLTGAWDAPTGGRASVEIRGLDAGRWRHFLRPVLGDPAPGFTAKGTARAKVDATVDPALAWTARGTATVDGSGFASDDGARVVEGLDTRWTFSASGAGSAARGEASAEVGGFQALWGSFFADYSGLPSAIESTAEVDGAAWSARLAWSWPEGPRIVAAASGEGGKERVAFDASLAVDDLGSTLTRYLREPLGSTVPFLEKIRGNGALRVEGRGTIDDVLAVEGRLRSDGLSVSGTQGIVEIEGLALDLPFDLRWGAPDGDGRRPLSGREREGSLRFARFAAAGMEIPATETGLRIRADSVELLEPLAFPLLDGIAGFERLTLTEFARPSRRLESALLLSKIDLATVSKAFDLPPLSGTVDGYFPKVVVTGPAFEVEGGGEIEIFGGKVTIGGISGEDVLTRFPKLRLSAEFEGVDLARVTRTFDFGDMTGIVRGHVRDLTLFRGVPVAFAALVRSVPESGVRGRINVKAVNNLAILSTGSPGLLDRGIQKFIDSFTYESLGIELALANDVFLMRGLERRGDRELFVKGRLPFPIDIVNAQPGRTVSFRAMRERIGNVDFSVGGKGPPKPR